MTMGLLDELDPQGGGDFERSESWVPTQAGESIEGIVERMSSVETDYGTMAIAEVRDAAGVLHGVFGKGSLGRDFTYFQLAPGDSFAVRFDGKRTSSTGREYNAFRSAARKPDGRLIKTSDRLDAENPEKAAEIAAARAKRAADQAAQAAAPRAVPVGAQHLDQPAPSSHTPGYRQSGPPPAGSSQVPSGYDPAQDAPPF
jgi:hypothetical protein